MPKQLPTKLQLLGVIKNPSEPGTVEARYESEKPKIPPEPRAEPFRY